MIESLNKEIKRQAKKIVFPNGEALDYCLVPMNTK
ncbi:hypothetical protein [Streptococcus mitis]|nr:hypothetical protein [Streptococcus mitis]